jgi:hypothetical protein
MINFPMPSFSAQLHIFNFGETVHIFGPIYHSFISLMIHLKPEVDDIPSHYHLQLILNLILSFVTHIAFARINVQAYCIIAVKNDFFCFIIQAFASSPTTIMILFLTTSKKIDIFYLIH